MNKIQDRGKCVLEQLTGVEINHSMAYKINSQPLIAYNNNNNNKLLNKINTCQFSDQ